MEVYTQRRNLFFFKCRFFLFLLFDLVINSNLLLILNLIFRSSPFNQFSSSIKLPLTCSLSLWWSCGSYLLLNLLRGNSILQFNFLFLEVVLVAIITEHIIIMIRLDISIQIISFIVA